MAEMAHVLYRFYSATGQLLYVGITMNPPQRFRAHSGDKEWWSGVSGISVENYSSRKELEQAERRAIQVERPLHNVVHAKVKKPPKHRAPEPSDSNNSGRLTYLCDRCGHPVAAEAGYIQVSEDEIAEHRDLLAEWESTAGEEIGGVTGRILTGEDLFNMPERAKWQVLHAECDPDPDAGHYYWFDVGRADTPAALLSWTAHLLGKQWLNDTNWDEFIRARLSPKVLAV